MRFFITATNTGVGKTTTTLRLLEIAHKKGFKVGVIKPIETGVAAVATDGSKLLSKCQELNPHFKEVALEDVVPYQFKLPAAPYVAKKESIEIEKIQKKVEELEKFCDILFIEGAGGLMVPIEKNFFMIDLIKMLNAPTLLVTPSRLGSINETLLSMEALIKREIPFDWYINLFEDKEAFFETTLPFYQDLFTHVPLDLESVFNRYVNRYLT